MRVASVRVASMRVSSVTVASMSFRITGLSSLVPGPEEEGAGCAEAQFTDGETEAHCSVPDFTLQVGVGVGKHLGVQPESKTRVWGPQSGAHPTMILSASLCRRGGALPSMNIPSAFFQFQLQFRVRCRGLAI